MKALIDLHTHTIVSGHAYSTVQENIQAAINCGLEYLGLSEHGPNMPASPHLYYFQNIHCIPKQVDGLKILRGVEANIIDYDGNIDIDEELSKYMDYMIVSLHPPCIEYGTEEQNTVAIINAMKHNKVKVIGHLDDSRYPVDYERVVKAAKGKDILFEINNSSLKPESFREGAFENVGYLLKYCKEHGVKVIFGSDAHISYDVGKFHNCENAIEKYDFPKELVINYDEKEIKRIFELHQV